MCVLYGVTWCEVRSICEGTDTYLSIGFIATSSRLCMRVGAICAWDVFLAVCIGIRADTEADADGTSSCLI